MARSSVTGHREVAAKLRALQRNLVSGLDADIKESIEPMRFQIETNARMLRQPGRRPKGGHLDEGVAVGKVGGSVNHRRWILGFKGRARKIAHLVDFGTAPHWQPNRFGGIMHPGARPTGFARKGYEAKKSDVSKTLAQRIASRIRSAAR